MTKLNTQGRNLACICSHLDSKIPSAFTTLVSTGFHSPASSRGETEGWGKGTRPYSYTRYLEELFFSWLSLPSPFVSFQELPSCISTSKCWQDVFIFFLNFTANSYQRDHIRMHSVKHLAGFQSCLVCLDAKPPCILKGWGCPITPK